MDPEKAVNLGVAAHITAAAAGGPRYNHQLTSALRCSIGNAIWLCQTCAKLIDDDLLRHPEQLLHHWKSLAERDAQRRVGKTQSTKSLVSNAERSLKRDLKLRDELQQILIKPWNEIQETRKQKGRERPRDTFRYSKLMIHQLGKKKYEEREDDSSISSSFRLEPFDFYHNGIKFILWIESGAIENCMGFPGNMHWATIPYGARVKDDFRTISIWHLGLIPFRNIRHCDPQGDEYYDTPHLYCDFNIDGMPYEGFEHAVVAKDDELHDWPLKEELRLPTETVLAQDDANNKDASDIPE